MTVQLPATREQRTLQTISTALVVIAIALVALAGVGVYNTWLAEDGAEAQTGDTATTQPSSFPQGFQLNSLFGNLDGRLQAIDNSIERLTRGLGDVSFYLCRMESANPVMCSRG